MVAVRSDIPNTHTGFGVTYAELGNYVKIQHADGYLTMHAHLNCGSPQVKVGMKVTKGQFLGTAGATGQSSGCHEHFQLEKDDVHIDPMAVYEGRLVLRAPATPVVNTGGLAVGDGVTVKPSSKWNNGAAVAAFVYSMKMYVTSVYGNSETAVISTSTGGAATGRIAVGHSISLRSSADGVRKFPLFTNRSVTELRRSTFLNAPITLGTRAWL